ncbi:MAG: hypothetical protein D6778_08285 [Nitrospirae bacterium]|nr:MAG: hypothetical protein D6778_08285 [Nitrospirota bacterium]
MKLNFDIKVLKKIDLNKVPRWAKYTIMFGVPTVVLVLFFFMGYQPKSEEIKKLKKVVAQQQSEIEKAETKLRKLPELKKRYEEVKGEYEALKRQLPEEKEITNLLKEVSDLALGSELSIKLWKPGKKKLHQSNIVYEIPVRVEMLGSYHRLGQFFSALTDLDRIINISNIKMEKPKTQGREAILSISFDAKTFTAVPEEELKKMKAKKKKGRRKRRRR